MARIKMWTWGYFPFVMGGDTYQPISTEVEAVGPFDLGKGYQGYFTVDPKTGRTFVVESVTGGIVGSFIEDVQRDIAEGDEAIMAQQIEQYRGKLAQSKLLPNDEFFGSFRRKPSEQH